MNLTKLTVVVAAFALTGGAWGKTSYGTKGFGGAFSDPETWNGKGVPQEDETDAYVTLNVLQDGVAYTNDLPFTPYLHGLYFSGDASEYPDAVRVTLAGSAIRLWREQYGGGLSLSASLPVGSVAEVTAPVIAAYPSTFVAAPAGRTLVLSGPITHEPVDPQYYPASVTDALWSTNCFRFNGAGTNILRGVYHVDNAVSYVNGHDAVQFENGTTIVENELYLPRFVINSGTFVVAPGGVVRNWKSVATIGTAEVDINGGYWNPKANVYWADTAAKTARVRVRNGGYWHMGDLEVLGKAGLTEVFVEDGGYMYLRGPAYQGFSAGGSTHLTISGGVVKEGAYSCFFGSLENAAADNWIWLKGGELRVTHLSQYAKEGSAGKNVDVKFFPDGGALVVSVDGNTGSSVLDPFVKGAVSKFHTHVRAGGFVFDTARHQVNYNAAISGTDEADSTDGGLVKLGLGVLKLSEPCAYVGTNVVRGGTLELAAANASAASVVCDGATLKVDDAAFYANPVRLERGGRLAFVGAGLTVSALSAANGGVLALTPGEQALTVTAAPELEGELGFELPGAAANGTYEVLRTASADAALAAKCRVANPAAGKAYSFAAANGAVSVTVADGAAVTGWAKDGGGAWTAADAWDGGVPDAVGAVAKFGAKPTANATVDFAADVTVGSLLLDNANAIGFNDNGKTMTFDGGDAAAALIDVTKGNHTLGLDVAVEGTLVARVAKNQSLTLAGDVASDDPDARLLIRGEGSAYLSGDCQLPVSIEETALLRLQKDAKLSAGVTVGDGATLRMEGDAELSGPLNLAVGAKLYSAANAALTVDEAPASLALNYSSDRAPVVAFRDLSPLASLYLRFATLGYAGTEEGCLDADVQLVGVGASYPATVRRMPGSGDLTVRGRFRTESGTPAMRFVSDMDGEIALDGSWNESAYNVYYRLGGGRIRLAPGFSYFSAKATAGLFRVGGDDGQETSVTMDAGARVSAYDLTLASETGAKTGDVLFTQKGGSVALQDGLVFGVNVAQNAKTYRMEGGALTTPEASWSRFLYGPSALLVDGGEMTLGNVVFGSPANDAVSYAVTTMPTASGSTDVRADGGTLTVAGQLDLSGDADPHRYNRLVAGTNGTVNVRAAIRTAAGDGLLGGGAYGALGLDGGVLNLVGLGPDAASSLADYFPGVGAIALGANGGAIDTCGNDVTVGAPLQATSAGGTFAKVGAGSLTLAGASVVRGGLAVEEGTLALRPAETKVRDFGDGLVAYWDFEGDDPLADKSGHGFDLRQMHATQNVAFTEENAFDGTSASWGSKVWAYLAAFTNADEKILANEFTVSLFARLESWESLYASDDERTIFSTKIQLQRSSYAPTADALMSEKGADGTFSSSLDSKKVMSKVDVSSLFTLGDWHCLTYVRKGAEIRFYVDGQLVHRQSTTSNVFATMDFLGEGEVADGSRCLSFGRGTHSQYCGFKNMMLDDIAVYRRALTDAEVAKYSAEKGAVATPDVAVAAGATLDLRGGSLAVPTLAGGGTVNGAVTVLERLVSDPASPLHVSTLAFADGGTIDLGLPADAKTKTGYVQTVATFDALDASAETALGGWTVTGLGRGGNPLYGGRVIVDREAKTVSVEVQGPGVLMIVR